MTISQRKVGGIRFIRLGAFRFSFCVARQPAPQPFARALSYSAALMISLAMWGGMGAGCVAVTSTESTESTALAFALVSYRVDASGALHAETLDSGLTVDDCAFALSVAPQAESELLLTCEPESAQ